MIRHQIVEFSQISKIQSHTQRVFSDFRHIQNLICQRMIQKVHFYRQLNSILSNLKVHHLFAGGVPFLCQVLMLWYN